MPTFFSSFVVETTANFNDDYNISKSDYAAQRKD